MKKLFITLLVFVCTTTTVLAQNDKNTELISSIGFHKKSDIPAEIQIRKIFEQYQKYTNSQNIDGFMNLHDESYVSTDGYNKNRLKELALEAWKEFPDVKYTIKVISVNVDIDNATVITTERMSGLSNASVEYIKGTGYIDSESTAVYYLKKYSNDWRITSDFIINEKSSMRYGVAKYIPMKLDAPSIVAPNEEYTAILKINVPKHYVALVSINNEPITYPTERSTEVFRSIKADGTRERILTSNDGKKNENAIASIGIAKPQISNDAINVNLLGIAFLSSRVNVLEHKYSSFNIENKKIQKSIEKDEDAANNKSQTSGEKKSK